MAHRSTGHAARRRFLSARQDVTWGYVQREDLAHPGHQVLSDFDATTYDDVIPHRLRGTLRLDDDGDPASLVDLVADRSLS